MIFVRAPLRVSLFGGGSDFKNFYKTRNAAVLSFSFNKYVNVIIKKSFSNNFILSYSKKEICKNINKIKHPIIRETLRYFGVKEPLEIVSISDIPGKGSGLGASSAFACAMVKGTSEYLGKNLTNAQVANLASYIEIIKCKSNIGKQDHYASAIGGFNLTKFYSFEKVVIKNIKTVKAKNLLNNFFLVPTNIYRKANVVLKKQQLKKNIKNRNFQISKLVKIAISVATNLKKNNFSPSLNLGSELHNAWKIKKKISQSITNKKIDRLYDLGIESGSTGGKLLGAGGGGFILFYVPKKNQKRFKLHFAKTSFFKPRLDTQGIKVMHVNED
jgi:D-glycero-alpha-D-manno-heptose-7-phosphate kinase